jgi:hypothetical protein
MSRQLQLSLVFLVLALLLGLAYAGQSERAKRSHAKMFEVTLEDGTNQATIDYYEEKWESELARSALYLIGTGACGFISLALLLIGTRRSFKRRAAVKYEIEERRHQEMLEVTRQASRLPQSEVRQPSLLYTANAHPLTPQPPTADQILSEAQRVYKEGNLDLAIFILETTDDPRAQKVLAKLRGMKK